MTGKIPGILLTTSPVNPEIITSVIDGITRLPLRAAILGLFSVIVLFFSPRVLELFPNELWRFIILFLIIAIIAGFGWFFWTTSDEYRSKALPLKEELRRTLAEQDSVLRALNNQTESIATSLDSLRLLKENLLTIKSEVQSQSTIHKIDEMIDSLDQEMISTRYMLETIQSGTAITPETYRAILDEGLE